MKNAVIHYLMSTIIHDDVTTKSHDFDGFRIGTSIRRGVSDEDFHCSAAEEVQHCHLGHIYTYPGGSLQLEDIIMHDQYWDDTVDDDDWEANYHTSSVHS